MEQFDALLLERQLCFPLYAAAREVVKQYRPLLDPLNLTYTQYIAMMVIWEEGTVSVRDLGKRLYLDSGTLTPVLKSLEAKGLIRRYRCSEDERVLLVEATGEGLALKEKASHIPEEMGHCVRLAPEEAEELYRLLYRLLGRMQ